MAVRGHAEPGGDFAVQDICFLGLAPQPPRPPPPTEDKYVALVSGLGLGRPETDMLKVGAYAHSHALSVYVLSNS